MCQRSDPRVKASVVLQALAGALEYPRSWPCDARRWLAPGCATAPPRPAVL